MTRSDLRLSAACAAAGLLFTGASLHAAGYAIAEQSISGLGYGFAGAAAIAEDSSTIWHNPAGMSFLGEDANFVAGVHVIVPKAKFHNTGTVSVGFNATGGQVLVPTQGPDDTSDEGAIVPNLYYSHPVGEKVVLGLGITAPFGLATKYADGWVGRYVAIETDLQTVNVNPSLAYKVSDRFSIGVGLNAVRADAVLSNALDFGLIAFSNAQLRPLLPATLQQDIAANRGSTKYDGFLELEGDGMGYGFNFGFLFAPSEGVRIGLHYRSAIDLELEGDADFTIGALGTIAPLAAAFPDQGGAVDLTLPSNISLSVAAEVTDRLTLLGDVTWTDWSQFEELAIRFETGSPATRPIPENWEDTWRFSVGARYIVNEHLALRGGWVIDQAAAPGSEYISPRIPDADRMWLALGAQWQIGGGWALDVAYAHIFVDDGTTNNSTHTPGNVLIGENTASVNIFSLGAHYRY